MASLRANGTSALASPIGVVVRQLSDLFCEVGQTSGVRFPMVLQQFPVLRAMHKGKIMSVACSRNGAFSPDMQFAKDGLRMMAMAGATYAKDISQKRAQNGLHSVTEIATASVAKRAGIEEKDVIKVSLIGRDLAALVPRHFVAVDHKTHSLIISVRGTKSVEDIYTNLVCKPLPFCNGIAHEGIALAAHALWEHLHEFVEHRLPANYDLRLVGHSLGGGIAALTALRMLLDRKFSSLRRRTKISCWAVAPPPVINFEARDLPKRIRNRIHCFVNRDDCVPTLSLAKVARVINFMRELDRVQWREKLRIFLSRRRPDDILLSLPEHLANQFTDLHLPGNIYWIWGEDDIRLVSASELGELIVSDTMILNHLVGAYERTMKQVIDGTLCSATKKSSCHGADRASNARFSSIYLPSAITSTFGAVFISKC